MAARYFIDFAAANILVIGAGEMSRLALKALLQRHAGHVTVANRTLARAEAALLSHQWRVVDFADVADSLHTYDVVFSATSAVDFIISREQMISAQHRRHNARKQVLIDLALPRDIDPSIRELQGVTLIDVDDLRQGIDQSLENRKRALPMVETIIAEELSHWQSEQRELLLRPLVVELRQRAEHIRQNEVDRTMRHLGDVDDLTRDHIQHLSRAIVNKLLHEPTIRIKELAQSDEPEPYLAAICDLFGLDADFYTPNYPENVELRGELSAD
jgi:glutamyl-tRNA reductase